MAAAAKALGDVGDVRPGAPPNQGLSRGSGTRIGDELRSAAPMAAAAACEACSPGFCGDGDGTGGMASIAAGESAAICNPSQGMDHSPKSRLSKLTGEWSNVWPPGGVDMRVAVRVTKCFLAMEGASSRKAGLEGSRGPVSTARPGKDRAQPSRSNKSASSSPPPSTKPPSCHISCKKPRMKRSSMSMATCATPSGACLRSSVSPFPNSIAKRPGIHRIAFSI
mmetsp:Transcript_174633/g.559954  ORF Transcript_174633/g.559954 Transcript_174633/m.559954 type:complete len:223 (+) Transcript_174633:670-1338(+)